jgi:hypothetical protein
MVEGRTHQIDKESWRKWSFYIDVIVFIIIAICIYLLIADSYRAGTYQSAGGVVLSNAWLTIARDVAFIAVALSWVFFRMYMYRGELYRRYR